MCAGTRNEVFLIPLLFAVYWGSELLCEYTSMYMSGIMASVMAERRCWKILCRGPKLEERKVWPTHYGFLLQNPAIYSMHWRHAYKTLRDKGNPSSFSPPPKGWTLANNSGEKQFKSNLKYVGMPCAASEWARYCDCILGAMEFSNGISVTFCGRRKGNRPQEHKQWLRF